jgi:hypothetical protein
MHFHTFIIGIQFNEKMFRLPSLGGIIIDEVLKLRGSEKKIKDSYFTKVSTPITSANEYTISLIDDEGENTLSILPDQFIFKKRVITSKSTVNVEKAIQDFQVFWKTVNKIVDFPSARRIGFVAEFRIDEKETDNAGPELVDTLTKIKKPNSCSRFKLEFEDRDLSKGGSRSSIETDDFWNRLFTFYISDMDEKPEKGKINANIDLQKYYSPAKADPIKELAEFKTRFKTEKAKFKEQLIELGLFK